MVEVSCTVVELGEARVHTSGGKLGLNLGKPNPSIICPELQKLDSNGVDVERGIGGVVEEGLVLKKTLLIVSTRGQPV